MNRIRAGFALAAAAALAASGAAAQVTPEMKAKIAAIGDVVDPPSTAVLYRPLHGSAPYAGVEVVRDQAYGSTPRNVLDVFHRRTREAPRPVLIFVPGGGGNKIEPVPQGDAFYDNIMLWAVKNGMTGVNIQRRGFGGDDSAQDVSAAIQWVKKNIGQYGGDPERIFIWGHSAGANSLSNYLSHPAFWGPGGVGVKGAVLMAGPYNLYPIQMKSPPMRMRLGPPGGPGGPPPPGPGGPGGPPPGGPPPGLPGMPTDPAALARASVLPGLKTVQTPLFISVAEIDPPIMVEAAEVLNRELRAAGKTPGFMIFKDHGHMSEVFAVNTADESTSKPILDWIRTIR